MGPLRRAAPKLWIFVQYRSSVPGIFMRHILEHNYEWARVLDSALASFTQRMALITPERATTQEIAFQHDGTAVWRRLGVAIWSE